MFNLSYSNPILNPVTFLEFLSDLVRSIINYDGVVILPVIIIMAIVLFQAITVDI